MATLKPSLASCSAQPKPMPREPPVTNATGFDEVVIINKVGGKGARKSLLVLRFRACLRQSKLRLKFGQVDPLALVGTFNAEFCELHTLGTFEEVPFKWFVEHDVT